ncbi:MAG: hypothetical protein OXE93_07525 [bacterium]|nr:hypothetical protein [bacterium]
MKRVLPPLRATLTYVLTLTLITSACTSSSPTQQSSSVNNAETTPSTEPNPIPAYSPPPNLRGFLQVRTPDFPSSYAFDMLNSFLEIHPNILQIGNDASGVHETISPWEIFCLSEPNDPWGNNISFPLDSDYDLIGAAGILISGSTIPDQMISLCEKNKTQWIKLEVGSFTTVLITGSDMSLDCLNYEDIYALIGPESAEFIQWSDGKEVASELGSLTMLPDIPLSVYGTSFENFIDSQNIPYGVLYTTIILPNLVKRKLIATKILFVDELLRGDYSVIKINDNISEIFQAQSTSLGWTNFEIAKKAKGIKILSIDSGQGCIQPTQETIFSSAYPVSWPIYLYINIAIKKYSPHKVAFVDFLLYDLFQNSYNQSTASRHSITPLPKSEQTKILAAWNDA